jgi:exodeoxyribonuclease VII small subunit
MTKRRTSDDEAFDFEAALRELEGLVEKMEQGELSLEQSLADFERGIELTRACQRALQEAEQKVQVLLEQNGKDDLAPFENSED